MIFSAFQLKVTGFGLLSLFKKHTAQPPLLNGFTQASRLSFLAYLKPWMPMVSWSIAIASLLVKILSVCAVILVISLPAISGAAIMHQSDKCARSSPGVIPLPTSSISGSFQWSLPAYLFRLALK